MAEQITGNVTGKIKFSIDQKSWENLTRFQTKLTNIKNQLKGISGDIKVNVVVNSINKVANATVAAEQKIANAKIATTQKVAKAQQQVNKKNHPKLERINSITGVSSAGQQLDPRSKKRLSDIEWWNRQIAKQEAMLNKGSKVSYKDPVNQMYSGSSNTNRTKDLTYVQMWQDLLREKEASERQAARDKRNADKRVAKEKAQQANNAAELNASDGSRTGSYLIRKQLQIASYGKMRNKGRHWIDTENAKLAEKARDALKAFDVTTPAGYRQYKDAITSATKALLDNERAAHRNKITFASMRNELVQLTAAYTAFSALVSTGQVGMQWEGLNASARVFAKDDAGVLDHMSFIREEADRLGVDLKTAAKEFTKFSIATQSSMNKNEQRSLFTGISEYATVMGVSQQDYERAFRAVQQIECCLPIQ